MAFLTLSTAFFTSKADVLFYIITDLLDSELIHVVNVSLNESLNVSPNVSLNVSINASFNVSLNDDPQILKFQLLQPST